MDDREKALKAFEICYTLGHNCTECPLFQEDDCNDKLTHDVLALLKEREPIAPSVCGSKEPDGLSSWWYLCSKCKMPIDYGDRFCRRCGRAVKWDGSSSEIPNS